MNENDKNQFIASVLRLANDPTVFPTHPEYTCDFAKGVDFAKETIKDILRFYQVCYGLKDFKF